MWKLFLCGRNANYKLMNLAQLNREEKKVKLELYFTYFLMVFTLLISLFMIINDPTATWMMVVSSVYIALIDESQKKLKQIRSIINGYY